MFILLDTLPCTVKTTRSCNTCPYGHIAKFVKITYFGYCMHMYTLRNIGSKIGFRNLKLKNVKAHLLPLLITKMHKKRIGFELKLVEAVFVLNNI